MTISLPRCRKMAAVQGLTVLQVPGYRGRGYMRRYAVLRTDQWFRLGIHAPYIKYAGLRTLCEGLQTPERK